MKFADIILPIASPKLYTYSIPEKLQGQIKPGQRVIVEVRKKLYTGIIERTHQQKPEYPTKEISDIIDKEPFIDEKQLKFWHWIADYYMCTIGEVYVAALPPSLRLEGEQTVYLHSTDLQGILLSPDEQEIIDLIKKKNYTIDYLRKKTQNPKILRTIKSLVEKGIVRTGQNVENPYKPRTEKYVRLAQEIDSEEKLNKIFNELSRAKKQSDLLLAYMSLSKFSFGHPIKEVKYKDLLEKVNSPSALKALTDKKILEVYEKQVLRIGEDVEASSEINPLTPAQQQAYDQISHLFKNKGVVLLHGITGSGKTEIYIRLIQEQIEQGKQVLYLLPEIAITSQIVTRLQAVFGDKVGFYHSKLNDLERAEVWQRLNRPLAGHDSYKIIIGVRSAIFLPFRNLGLIIVDEEHENTYKQFEPAPRYNARDAAIMLAQLSDARVLLGTATPSVETYYKAKTGKYGLVELTERFEKIDLPQIILADTKEASQKKQMKGIFHPLLLDNIQQALDAGKQVILFRNRRGFAPYMECQDCGWIPKCKHCDVSLTYHKEDNKMVCHYCGYSIDIPRQCPKCGSFKIQIRSFGTERIEDDLKIFFPQANIHRLDLDSTRGKHSHQRIIEQFQSGQINILVGTQMVTKGLDFHNVSLVGILNADSLINFPDFRAMERAFQLMVQVSGRAGRRGSRGRVIIQTSQPEHPVFHYVMENDYQGLYQWIINERKEFNYPPFTRLIKITVKYKEEAMVDTFSKFLADSLRKYLKHRVLGPEYPLVKKIQNWYRKEILIKLEQGVSLTKVKNIIRTETDRIRRMENFYKIRVIFDVDPM